MCLISKEINRSIDTYRFARDLLLQANHGQFDKRRAHVAFNKARGRLQSVAKAASVLLRPSP